jgi:hypothetical protein
MSATGGNEVLVAACTTLMDIVSVMDRLASFN